MRASSAAGRPEEAAVWRWTPAYVRRACASKRDNRVGALGWPTMAVAVDAATRPTCDVHMQSKWRNNHVDVGGQ